jgi:hypothetical protein
MVDAINVAFTPAYGPLIVEIDKACDACGVSRSGLIRSILCDIFEFTPKRPQKQYNSYKKRVKQ